MHQKNASFVFDNINKEFERSRSKAIHFLSKILSSPRSLKGKFCWDEKIQKCWKFFAFVSEHCASFGIDIFGNFGKQNISILVNKIDHISKTKNYNKKKTPKLKNPFQNIVHLLG